MPPLPDTITIPAKPYAYKLPTARTALLALDLHRDFLLSSGYGALQPGTNLIGVQDCLPHCVYLLTLFRNLQLPIFHAREGYAPDLSDCPATKIYRQCSTPQQQQQQQQQHGKTVGDQGKMGRLLVRGEPGNDFVYDVRPRRGEIVVDKPGKSAFWGTGLMDDLVAMGVTHLVVCGVTTEGSVATTVREANDRGFECCIVNESTAGFNDAFKAPTLEQVHWSNGLFGYTCSLHDFSSVFAPHLVDTQAHGETSNWNGSLDMVSLATAYSQGYPVTSVIKDVYQRIRSHVSAIWIHLIPEHEVLEVAEALEAKYPDRSDLPPLFGIPFSIKDSINLANIPTTAACPPLVYTPTTSSAVIVKLISLGAIPIGKTNLDQLATGLTGCRSPYGLPRCTFNRDYISGGSSSGSAVSVGADLVSFSVGTDTAGSGRIPAGFNGIVGWKPTRGTVSFSGVVTACESLDCIAFMTKTVKDARKVWRLVRGYDPADRYALTYPPPLRPVNAMGAKRTQFHFAIPPAEMLAACSKAYLDLFMKAVGKMEKIGGEQVDIDWKPFEEAGELLYNGTFVYERLAGLSEGWLEENTTELHEVVRTVFGGVKKRGSTAADVFRDLHKMASCRQVINNTVFTPSNILILLVPTAPFHPTIAETLANPITINSTLGTFSHFANVLELCAAAVPAGTYPSPDGEGDLPFSVTMLGGPRTDALVLDVVERFERSMLGQKAI